MKYLQRSCGIHLIKLQIFQSAQAAQILSLQNLAIGDTFSDFGQQITLNK